MTDYDLITIGESMWRLSPPGGLRMESARSLDVNLGGAESNVAILVSRLGKQVAWWSRLPDNALGHNVAQILATYGVDSSGVYWQQNARLGTYFVEFGSAPRPTQVIYDRANSAASQMHPDDFDWSQFEYCKRLHLTGITPALSASCLETMRRAVREANAADVQVSFDVNYRAKLWSWAECRPVMNELASQSQLALVALRDARSLLDAPNLEAEALAKRLHEQWQGATVILTRGAEGALAYDGVQIHEAAAFDKVQVVDRIGSGDAFAGGLLVALLDGKPLPEAMRYGNAAAALKMTLPGDLALLWPHEIAALLTESASEIQR
jgi:2-dehydro-3-deoxygluconokinase